MFWRGAQDSSSYFMIAYTENINEYEKQLSYSEYKFHMRH